MSKRVVTKPKKTKSGRPVSKMGTCGCGKMSVYSRRNRKTGKQEKYCARCWQRKVESTREFKAAVVAEYKRNAARREKIRARRGEGLKPAADRASASKKPVRRVVKKK